MVGNTKHYPTTAISRFQAHPGIFSWVHSVFPMCMDVEPSSEAWTTYQWPYPERKVKVPQQPWTFNSFSASQNHLLHSRQNFDWFVLGQALCKQPRLRWWVHAPANTALHSDLKIKNPKCPADVVHFPLKVLRLKWSGMKIVDPHYFKLIQSVSLYLKQHHNLPLTNTWLETFYYFFPTNPTQTRLLSFF